MTIMNHILILAATLATLVATSCSEAPVFEQSPAERTEAYRRDLETRLQSAPHGWKLMYFSRVDSLLFRNSTERLEHTRVNPDRYGYGGYLFTIKFGEGHKLEMKADMGTTPEKIYTGTYDIRLGSSLQLSFTTYTPLHELVNSEFEGVSDFVYRYTDSEGRLIFSTGVSGLANRPYIVLSPLKSEAEWQGATTEAQIHRRFFERMEHPQLQIRHGSRLFFQSDVPFKDPRGDLSRENERNRKRYHLFLALRDRHELIFRAGYNGLGSGYAGTEDGLSFRPGFSVNSKTTFNDFQRVGDRFVCELVSVYDPQQQRFILVSKHLHPQGEPTNYIAEIINSKPEN